MTSVTRRASGISSLYEAELHDFRDLRRTLAEDLLDEAPIHTGKWQQLDTSASPVHATHELQHVTVWLKKLELSPEYLLDCVPADMPWAEDHFCERVCGRPVNPGRTHRYWPYHKGGQALHLRGGQLYDHNYMERFWPKEAGIYDSVNGSRGWRNCNEQAMGYRFPIGDLMDVVTLLVDEPMTRQAYLPVWFPEDTGATEKQRVPCTLGYHFMIRKGILSAQYFMRSVEIYRHFTNDVYLAIRLMQWIADEVNRRSMSDLPPILGLGQLSLHMTSFHGFVGDQHKIREL